METEFDAIEMLGDLDAGVFMQKVSHALRTVALAVCEHDRKGKVVFELELDKMGDSRQVILSHTLKLLKPTRRGKASEEDTTNTPMYVGAKGELSIMPFKQGDLFKNETRESA